MLVVDNSILSAVAKCDTLAYVEYALGLRTREESLAIAAGQAVHRGLRTWLDGGGIAGAMDAMAVYYERAVDLHLAKTKRAELGADDRRFAPEWVEAVFQQYLDRYEGKWPFKLVAGTPEKPVSAPFPATVPSGRPVVFVARLDAIVRKWESGGKWSLDHKTTKRASEWWIEKEKVSSQFSGQLWLSRQDAMKSILREKSILKEDYSLNGVILNVIEIPEPHKSQGICKDHKVSYQECSVRHAGGTMVYVTRTEAELEAWQRTARRLTLRYDRLQTLARERGIAGVVEVQMQGRWNQSCTFCSQREWCRVGRPTSAGAVKASFVEQPWDPRQEQE